MDDADASIILLLATAAACLFLTKNTNETKSKKKKCWVKEWRKGRKTCGNYHHFVKEINSTDPSDYRNFLRMDEICFNRILSRISNDIKKKDTCLRSAIPPAEKLIVTLRFLATGEDFKDLDFNTKLSFSFLSGCIIEVCESIYKNMKDKFLKVSN